MDPHSPTPTPIEDTPPCISPINVGDHILSPVFATSSGTLLLNTNDEIIEKKLLEKQTSKDSISSTSTFQDEKKEDLKTRMESIRKADRLQRFFGETVEYSLLCDQIASLGKNNEPSRRVRRGSSMSSIDFLKEPWSTTFSRKKKMDKLSGFFGHTVPLCDSRKQFFTTADMTWDSSQSFSFSDLPPELRERLRTNFMKLRKVFGQFIDKDMVDTAMSPALMSTLLNEPPEENASEDFFVKELKNALDSHMDPLELSLKSVSVNKFKKLQQLMGDSVTYDMVFKQMTKKGCIQLEKSEKAILRKRFDKLRNVFGEVLNESDFYQSVVVPHVHSAYSVNRGDSSEVGTKIVPTNSCRLWRSRSFDCLRNFKNRQRNFSKVVKHLGEPVPVEEIQAHSLEATYSQQAAMRSSQKLIKTFGATPPKEMLAKSVSLKNIDKIKFSEMEPNNMESPILEPTSEEACKSSRTPMEERRRQAMKASRLLGESVPLRV